jgi:hypothetical protein
MGVKNELVEYQAQHGPVGNIAFIRIRPSRAPNSKTGALLDERGNTPLRNLRAVHRVTSGEIQGALEYMESEGWLSPLVIGRHADPIDGGAAFDWHEHVTVQINPGCSKKVASYLYKRFGRDRVWVSVEEEPGVERDLVHTGCYPAAKLANRGYDDISDENLLEFIAQSHRLRRIEIAGPIRAARDPKRKRGLQLTDPPNTGPEAEFAKILAERDDLLSEHADGASSDSLDADAVLPAQAHENAERVPPTSRNAADEAPREPRLLRCHFAYFGLTLRWVARVADYAGWDDLMARYDLSLDIAEAKALAARATALLSSNPAIPESSSDESFDFESLVEWGPLPYDSAETQAAAGTGGRTAEPQRDRGPKAATGAASRRLTPETSDTERSCPGPVPHALAPESPNDVHRAHRISTELCEIITVELTVEAAAGATASMRIALAPSLLATVGRSAASSPPADK